MVLKELGLVGSAEMDKVEAARLETRRLRRARLEGVEPDIVRLESIHRKREAVRLGMTLVSKEDDQLAAANMAKIHNEEQPHPTFDYGTGPTPMYQDQDGNLVPLPMTSMDSNPALVPFTPFTPAAPTTMVDHSPAFPPGAHPILVNPDLVYTMWPTGDDLGARPLLPTQADDVPSFLPGSVPMAPATLYPLDNADQAELDVTPLLPESNELPAPPPPAPSLSSFEHTSIGYEELHEMLRNCDTILSPLLHQDQAFSSDLSSLASSTSPAFQSTSPAFPSASPVSSTPTMASQTTSSPMDLPVPGWNLSHGLDLADTMII